MSMSIECTLFVVDWVFEWIKIEGPKFAKNDQIYHFSGMLCTFLLNKVMEFETFSGRTNL